MLTWNTKGVYMDLKTLIARHESAHAVVAVFFGAGVYGGIDIDSINPSGGVGFAKVRLFDIDLTSLSGEELANAQKVEGRAIFASLMTILAGPASDAIVEGIDFDTALAGQPGDCDQAYRYLAKVGILDEEADSYIRSAGTKAVEVLGDGHIGDAILALADRLLALRSMDAETFQSEARKALDEAEKRRDALEGASEPDAS